MHTPYIERDCTIEHDGRTYESGGAMVTDEYVIGYFSKDQHGHYQITTWHGDHLGTALISASWPMPHSYVSSRQYQVEAKINGHTYTGRTMGDGMIWRGKRKKGG